MNQENFDREVAQATGESVKTIARRGFVLLTPVPVEREPPKADYEDFLRDTLTSGDPQTESLTPK